MSPVTDPIPHELHDLLDGRLDDEAAAAARTRIAEDAAWGEAWAELQRIQGWVRDHGADREPPPALRDAIRARIAVLAAKGPDGAEADPASMRATDDAAATPAGAPSARRPTRLLRILTVSYAAAALLVVGFTIGYVVMVDPPAVGTEGDLTVETADGIQPHGSVKDAVADAREQAKRLEGAAEAEGAGRAEEYAERRAGQPRAGFGGPGDGVPPGMRPPSDEPAPPPASTPPALTEKKARQASDEDEGQELGQPKRKARTGAAFAQAGELARDGERRRDGEPEQDDKAKQGDAWGNARDTLGRLASRMEAGDTVYVIETDDPVATRKRLETTLDALLATADAPRDDVDAPSEDAGEPLGLGGGARGRDPAAPGSPAPPAGAGAPTPQPARGGSTTPAPDRDEQRIERFYRLEPAAVAGLRARLADREARPLVVHGEIERPVRADLLTRLERALALAAADARPEAADASKSAAAAGNKPEAADAPRADPPAPSKRAKQPEATPAPRRARSGAEKPRRLRILIVERK